MNVVDLVPAPAKKTRFRRSHQKYVAAGSGCYVLSTFEGLVLYVGLASNIRRRMGDHLDNPEKTSLTASGRAVWFHWLETHETNKVERTWQNMHISAEGGLPPLNRVYSPT